MIILFQSEINHLIPGPLSGSWFRGLTDTQTHNHTRALQTQPQMVNTAHTPKLGTVQDSDKPNEEADVAGSPGRVHPFGMPSREHSRSR